MVEIGTNIARFEDTVFVGLERYTKKISGRVMLSGVAAMALVIYNEVKLNTSPPRMGKKTGALHDAVYRAFSPERSTEDTKYYHVSVNKRKAPHWHLIEYGTSRAIAHPYLRPAFDRMGQAVKKGKERVKELMASGDMV